MSDRMRTWFGKVLRRWADRIDYQDGEVAGVRVHFHMAHEPCNTTCTIYGGTPTDQPPTPVLIRDWPSTDPIQQAFNDAVDRFQIRRAGPGRGADGPPTVLEERIPADLNPWAGAGVVALHNHIETDMCDDTCTTYGEGPTT